MRVLVTGSTGFVGSHLCKALVEQGHTVRAFHRPSSNLRLLEGLEVEHAQGDLTQPETMTAAMEGMDVVFHCAAWMGSHDQPGRQYTVTVEGTRNVLQAARKTGVQRVVYTSSTAALGVPQAGNSGEERPLPVNENHTWNYQPHWYPYGYTKYLAELEAQKAAAQGLDVVIVNPSLIFGAGDAYRQSGSIVMQVAQRRISVAVEGGINAVHVEDVVSGHLAAMERGKCGQRYILGGENVTHLQLLQRIAEVTGTPAPTLVLPAWLVRAGAGPVSLFHAFLDLPVSGDLMRMAGYFFYYDLSKAREALDWQPVHPLREAIEETYAWFKSRR